MPTTKRPSPSRQCLVPELARERRSRQHAGGQPLSVDREEEEHGRKDSRESVPRLRSPESPAKRSELRNCC